MNNNCYIRVIITKQKNKCYLYKIAKKDLSKNSFFLNYVNILVKIFRK